MYITYRMIKKNSDYETVVLPFYREEAARTIQKAFKRFKARSNAFDKLQKIPRDQAYRRNLLAHYLATNARLPAISSLKINEPEDDGLYAHLTDKVKKGHYEEINFTHPDFIRRLYGCLRAEHITMTELLTIQLMYESLICFNFGKMPQNPRNYFSRHLLSEIGPYTPQSISYWGSREEEKLTHLLSDKSIDEPLHYYTIPLPRHIALGFLFFELEEYSQDSHLESMFFHYLQSKKDLSPSIRFELFTLLAELRLKPTINAPRLRSLLQKIEPNLWGVFTKTHYTSPSSPLNFGLNHHQFNKELDTIKFLLALHQTQTQLPMLCLSPQYNAATSDTPLFSFVIPTIKTFIALESICHGSESVLPIAMIGKQSIKMIRAYDEIPAIRHQSTSLHNLSAIQRQLTCLYPTASRLPKPSRPIELNHPDVPGLQKPHDYLCHPFLLSWHDLFHTWRSGSNFKAIFRKLRTMHDEKAGLAQSNTTMSKGSWGGTDIDSSIGGMMRTHLHTHGPIPPYFTARALLVIFNRAEIDFHQLHDDNYLLVNDIYQQYEAWSLLLGGYHPLSLTPQIYSENLTDSERGCLRNFCLLFNDIADYRLKRPEVSVAEIILHNLIAPAEPCDIVLFEKLAQIGYKNCLVWSRNNGLYFKPAIQAALATHLVKPRLRDNTPDKLRHALRWIVSTLGQPTPFAQNVFSLFFSAPGEKAMRAAAITIPDDRMLTLTSNLTEMRVSPIDDVNRSIHPKTRVLN